MRTFTVVAALFVILGLPSPSTARSTNRVGTTPTTTTLTVVPNPSVAGQPVTLTATVNPDDGTAGIPSGTVQFLQPDGAPLGTPQLLSNGQASAPAWAYAGTYSVRAVYSGDATFDTSTGSVDMVVDRADTTTTVSSSANPVSVGGTLSLTIVVSTAAPGDVAPGGTVGIVLNGLDVSGPIPLFDDTATASAVVVRVPSEFVAQPGSATIAARYNGDSNTRPSQSDGFTQSVTGPTPAPTPVPTAQPTPAPSPAPTAQPTPKPPTTATALSAMTATLTRALARRGLSALTTTTQRLSVAGPGTLVQRVYSPAASASATTSAAKPVLIANASRAFSAAGTGTIRLRLTASGRKAVRKGKALKIEIVSRFTNSSGADVTSSKKLTVKPHAKAASWAFARLVAPGPPTPSRPFDAFMR